MCAVRSGNYIENFGENFTISRDGVPGNWEIERNSDIEHPGIVLEDDVIKIFSPGNKFIPVIPELTDGRIEIKFAFDHDLNSRFDVRLLFRYDRRRRLGHGGRVVLKGEELVFEYGTIANNIFRPIQTRTIPFEVHALEQEITCILEFEADVMNLEIPGIGSADFAGLPTASGSVAICRGAFSGFLRITKFEVSTPDECVPQAERRFEITLPEGIDGNNYPITCAITVREYESLVDLDMKFTGSVQEEPLGDGNYHALRVDKVTRPFLRVMTTARVDTYTMADSTLMLTNHDMVPPYYYHALYEDPEWPMHRRIRFRKPDDDYVMSLGYEFFYHKPTAHQSGGPSESIFDITGKTLYSGRSLQDHHHLVTFESGHEKSIIVELPRDDPRYETAVAFARDNHYFKIGEEIRFNVIITSMRELPEAITLTLENAFFEVLEVREAEIVSVDTFTIGCLTGTKLVCRYAPGTLAPGVYHLRCRGASAIVDSLNEYIAFEVIPDHPEQKSAALASGIPYLFSSLTETRGLETDHFDPWRGKSVNTGHYISCVCFHPGFAKRNKIWNTIRPYKREWFCWLTDRTIDDYSLESNIEAVENCDYIYDNVISNGSLHRLMFYTGDLLACLLRFLETIENNPCRHLVLEKLTREEQLSKAAYDELCANYWDDWLDFAIEWLHTRRIERVTELQSYNPNIKLSTYGPVHIYASHYKGMNFTRYIGFDENATEYFKGFFLYEDYPVLSSYPFSKGVYFLTACKQVLPNTDIYPELYTICDQGCPDGALAYAFPPFGLNLNNPVIRIKRRIFEYAFATGWYDENGFHYWRDYGFHISAFEAQRYETLLTAWAVVKNHPPARPLRGTAFISNSECCRNAKSIPEPTGGSPIKTSEECIAFAYERSRNAGLQAGFQCSLESIVNLTDDNACIGKYRATDGTVLIDGEIPVLLTKQTGTGKTAFFNIPPTMVRRDSLHERDGHGRQCVSELINSATDAILEELSDAAVTTTAGEVIAFESEHGKTVVIVENTSADTTITPRIRIRKRRRDDTVASCDVPFDFISESTDDLLLRLRIEEDAPAVIIIG